MEAARRKTCAPLRVSKSCQPSSPGSSRVARFPSPSSSSLPSRLSQTWPISFTGWSDWNSSARSQSSTTVA